MSVLQDIQDIHKTLDDIMRKVQELEYVEVPDLSTFENLHKNKHKIDNYLAILDTTLSTVIKLDASMTRHQAFPKPEKEFIVQKSKHIKLIIQEKIRFAQRYWKIQYYYIHLKPTAPGA